MEYGVLDGSDAIKILIVANKFKKNLSQSGKRKTVSVSHEFIKAVIQTLQLKTETNYAIFDDINKFDCQFNIYKHYLDIKMKLEGAVEPDEI